MGRAGIEQLLYAFDRSLEGDPATPGRNWHGLMVNVASTDPADWNWAPEGGHRTIAQFLEELGGAIRVYASQGFGDKSQHWNVPGSVPVPATDARPEEWLDWVREGNRIFRACIEGLTDDEQLYERRLSPQGEMQETRWLIATMTEHNLYHSGEINHIRALRQGDDY